jgi:hypothetical protein
MATPRSVKRNLLNARDRLGESIIAIVERDVAEHGPEVIEQLRQKNVVAYARLVSDLVAFRKLKAERAPPKRKPRPLRMKSLLTELATHPARSPVPPGTNPMIARLIEAIRQLEPRSPADLSEEELTALWGDELARFYIDKILVRRRKRGKGVLPATRLERNVVCMVERLNDDRRLPRATLRLRGGGRCTSVSAPCGARAALGEGSARCQNAS